MKIERASPARAPRCPWRRQSCARRCTRAAGGRDLELGKWALFYGRNGDLASADREDQEIAVLALHLLKSALVHVNTILVQRVLEEPAGRTG